MIRSTTRNASAHSSRAMGVTQRIDRLDFSEWDDSNSVLLPKRSIAEMLPKFTSEHQNFLGGMPPDPPSSSEAAWRPHRISGGIGTPLFKILHPPLHCPVHLPHIHLVPTSQYLCNTCLVKMKRYRYNNAMNVPLVLKHILKYCPVQVGEVNQWFVG